MMVYHFSKAINGVMSDYSDIIIERLLEPDLSGVPIYDLLSQNNDFAEAFNEELKNSISVSNVFPASEADYDPEGDIATYLINLFSYNGILYNPVVYLIEKLDGDDYSRINVLIGAQENECDEIPGWSNNEPTLFSEDVLNKNELSIFVGIGQRLDEPLLVEYDENEPIHKSPIMTEVNIDLSLVQIKKGYRFERTGDSEIRAFAVTYWPETADPTGFRKFLDNKWSKSTINNSEVVEVGNLAYQMELNHFDRSREVFVTAYERDWYASEKLIPNTCSGWSTHNITSRMKYEDEFYFSECGDLNLFFPTVGTVRGIRNEKCGFAFIRTQ